jgi:membrane protein required for colicin V production
MVTTDWALLGVLLLSVLLGLWRGLMYEVLSLAGWVLAFILAQAFANDVAAWLPMDGLSSALKLAVAFVLVFVLVAFAGGLVAWLVQKLVATVGLRPVDRVLGGAFGLARALVMLLGLAVVVSVMQMQQAAWWRTSSAAGMLSATLLEIRPLLPEPVARHIR